MDATAQFIVDVCNLLEVTKTFTCVAEVHRSAMYYTQ